MRQTQVEATLVAWVLCALCAAGCAAVPIDEENPDRGDLADRLSPCDSECSSLELDLSANLKLEDRFYGLPYPADFRLQAGQMDFDGFPRPRGGSVHTDQLISLVRARNGASVVQTAYFGVQGSVPSLDPDTIVEGRDAPVLLLDVDPNSPHRGETYPVRLNDIRGDTAYTRQPLLAVSPYPGVVLHPRTQYAVIVRRSLGDGRGQFLDAPASLTALAAGEVPQGRWAREAATSLASMWPTLDALGIPRADIAGATVFTTGDVVAEAEDLSRRLAARHPREITGLRPLGPRHLRFCAVETEISMPQFQIGSPPFNTGGAIGQTALREERVPIVISLPRVPVTDSPRIPTMLYLHGSDGESTQVLDRGPRVDGRPTPGLGPAHVMARHGFATVGVALPLNPERYGTGKAYRNLNNLAAYPGTFLQGLVELRILADALAQVSIPPELIEACAGDAVYHPHAPLELDASELHVLGQSHGSAYAFMLGATDPRVTAVAPTGAPGLWADHALENAPHFLAGLVLFNTQHLRSMHPVAQLLQEAWEPAEPMVYAPRLAAHPLAGQPRRAVYMSAGAGDSAVPESIFAAMTTAAALPRAGGDHWDRPQDSFFETLHGCPPVATYPVRNNVAVGTTGVVAQYGQVIPNTHYILEDLDEVKRQYGCFFATHAATGSATVIEGAADTCPVRPRFDD